MRQLLAKTLRKLAAVADGAPGSVPPAVSLTSSGPADHHLRWIISSCAGWLEPGNIECFQHALQNLPGDAPILEIGSFCGLSANVLTHIKRKLGLANRLITCDVWDWGDGYLDDTPIPTKHYTDFVIESFIKNAQMFSGDDLPIDPLGFGDLAALMMSKRDRECFGNRGHDATSAAG